MKTNANAITTTKTNFCKACHNERFNIKSRVAVPHTCYLNGITGQPCLHELKTWPIEFNAVMRGEKKFEIRFNDRGFKISDELLLKEYMPDSSEYTGRFVHRRINYIYPGGQFGIEAGFVILGLEII